MQTQPTSIELIRDAKDVRGVVNATSSTPESRQPQTAVARQQAHLELTLRLQMSLDVEWVMD